MLPDYASWGEAIGLDWYAVDPNLRLLLDRLLPDADDRAFAEEHVATYGELCGGAIAATRRDHGQARPGAASATTNGASRSTAVVHHPTWIESKADLVRAGFTGLAHHADRPVPAVRDRGDVLPGVPGRDRDLLRARA